MRIWAGALSALVAIAAAIVAVELGPWPPSARADFPPFVMAIEEWNADRGTLPGGGTYAGTYIYRLEYHDQDDWSRTTSRDPLMCTSVDRWIHYGMAWSYRWRKEVGRGVITYSDPGERVVFDAKTGLPIVYEAGLTGGTATYRRTYRVERWGTGDSLTPHPGVAQWSLREIGSRAG